MSEAQIRIVVDQAEAKKALAEFERQLEEVERDAGNLEDKARSAGRGRSLRVSGSGQAGARNRAFQQEQKRETRQLLTMVGTILALAKGLQVGLNALAQKVEKIPGLGGAARGFQRASDEITAQTSLGARLGALNDTRGVLQEFSLSGQPLSQEAARAVYERKLAEQQRSAIERDRAASRGMSSGVDTFRALLGLGG